MEHAGLTKFEIAQRYPALAALDANWVHIVNDMTPMIGAMSDNVSNYQAVKSLPPFPLFPWFFVIPGVLVAGLAVAAGTRRSIAAQAGVGGVVRQRRAGAEFLADIKEFSRCLAPKGATS